MQLFLLLLLLSYLAPSEQLVYMAGARTPRHCDAYTIADSGASIHAIRDASLAVPGTLRPNTTSITTASGVTVPRFRCDAIIHAKATDGTVVRLMLNNAMVMPNAKHNLVSLGLLARDQGISTCINSESEGTYMSLPDSRRISLINAGVLILPDAGPQLEQAHSALLSEPPSGDHSTWTLLHNRFNGRSHDALRHLATCGKGVVREWKRALARAPKDACHSCLQARADKQPSRARVPPVDKPGFISYDIFEMGLPHLGTGKKYVIGFHDRFSKLNKVYLLLRKSDAGGAMDMFWAWCRSHGVEISGMHADNAEELTGPTLVDKWAARGIRLTSCAPHEPRGNGMMERQWRTIGADTRHVLTVASLPPSMWWYCMRASVRASYSIPINDAETPWSRFTGRIDNPAIHRVIGCLAYYRVVKPHSKAHARARRALHLGRAEDQPGYLVLDLETRSTIVTPHVRFVEDIFPGLVSSPRGGEPSPSDVQTLFERSDAAAAADDCSDFGPDLPHEIEGGTDVLDDLNADDDGIVISSDEPPALDASTSASHDGSASSTILEGGEIDEIQEPIEEEYANDYGTRTNAFIDGRVSGRTRSSSAAYLAVDDSGTPAVKPLPADRKFYLYLGSGHHRDGDLHSQLKERGGAPVICIDIKLAGYDHDMTDDHVQKRILDMALDARCLGVFVSIPCKTFSVLRNKPGIEYSYPLRSSQHVLGIPREDGSLPWKVTQSNAMSTFAAQVMRAVHDKGGVFAAESPPSRGAGSRFPLGGREEHVSQFDHPDWIALREDTGADMIYFDQCPLYGDPPPASRKKTALLVNPKGFDSFYKRFAPLMCSHTFGAHQGSFGVKDDGQFTSSATENYPPRMNALIAESLIESCEHDDALLAWHCHFASGDALAWPEQGGERVPDSLALLKSAAPLLASTNAFSNRLYETGPVSYTHLTLPTIYSV